VSVFQYRILAGIVAIAGVWYFWPDKEDPQLMTGPMSVVYDSETTRLTAIVNIENRTDRPIVASITNDLFVDSQKQMMNDPRQPRQWRTEVASRQVRPVTFTLQGDVATAVWDGVRLMEITMTAAYDGSSKLNCQLNFMGRFYPQLKQIGTVSNVTSPRSCRGLRSRPSS
jgi:hypothetical protein